jgi:serine/threonine-protein kinase HipA
MPTAYVYVHLEEGPVSAGILETSGTGREVGARFRYGRRYLQREDRLAIDPVQLPLTAPDADWEYITEEGSALFNGIRDAAPDGWGVEFIVSIGRRMSTSALKIQVACVTLSHLRRRHGLNRLQHM